MAQPNVAREPSMEEILASIRRIIESNEPETTTNELARLAALEIAEPDAMEPAEGQGAVVDEIRLTIEDELPSFVPPRPVPQPAAQQNQPVERPLHPSQPRPQPQPVSATAPPVAANAADVHPTVQGARREDEPRSISLADVAARVRAASERSETVRPIVASPEAARQTDMLAQPVIRTVEAVARPASPAPVASMPSPEPVETESPAAPETGFENEHFVMADLIDTSSDEPQVDFTIDPAPTEEENAVSLVSRHTGDQVARSFHELAEMVHMSAQRSLDDIAGEMLRPMLQEWLDDNLPTLVERLVREEIERVARGPRR